ncbi:GntR family transcriptional regulator [Arachidicoccus ginsenosidimutans]|uniref:GntR family transcriptional regulator n=1 Tax=Arachidicoccus sp. BS20 TaxID=1850526 RepID=UPI0007F10632|nr:GntR family transcriptional regulator [Arachidicoccus sp. BS20]ANI88332.1 GntR family transcriptional regulator [Arachidicoccus sp. BS20]ANI88338.1 GntR family transcriptional regulator [Arachidicoccus sp. BS20]
MKNIYDEIRALQNIHGLSKHEQFVEGILNALQNKSLFKGDKLPSVNEFIQELGFARETISKAYRDLIKRGIVESRNRVGFFVAHEDVSQHLKIALVLFAFDTIQETFYKTFREKLGKGIHIDVYFHHNNIQVFESIISSVRGKYGMYVIAPIPHKKTESILKTLPMERFLMIDRYEPMKGVFSYVTQEFEDASYRVFEQLFPKIKKYKKGVVYYHRPNSDTPVEILNAVKKFVKKYKIRHEILPEYISGSIEKGAVYYTINNAELWMMLKDAQEKKFVFGKDIGILSHNDDIVKEIICGGITTYSTDFKQMAERAAAFVLANEKIQETIPTVLIDRKSL